MSANQAGYPVHTLCRVLDVSHSGYSDWQKRVPSKCAMEDAVLSECSAQVHAESRQTYGRPRIRAELAEQGVRVSGKRIARLMRRCGIQGFSKRRAYAVTTRRDPRVRPTPDPVKRTHDR